MDHSGNEDLDCKPLDLLEAANIESVNNLIPNKSKSQYENAYKEFKSWCMKSKVNKITENILLAFFEEKSKNVKSSTLWSLYSMIKTTLNINDNVNIKKFTKIIPYLKQKSIGYRPKKSRVLSKEQITKFLEEADINEHLLTKVILIIGLFGACRRDEIVKIRLQDVQDLEKVIIITLPNTKTNMDRIFTISSSSSHLYINLCRQYMSLRPQNTSTDRFFIKYSKGKCFNQNVGINKIGQTPSLIASYLNLPEPECYTGHCFRRTSVTFLADAGGDLITIKRHGESSTIAEECIEDSICNKIKISQKILESNVTGNVNHLESVPDEFSFTDDVDEISVSGSSIPQNTTNIDLKSLSASGIYIGNNCTVNINIVNNK